jgi:hypothetical protein
MKCLLLEEIEPNLLEEFTASDQRSANDDDESSGTDDLTVGEIIISEYSDVESDVCNVLLHRGSLVLRLRGRS